MNRIRPIGLALVAMFAFSAFAASAATAAEGPFFKAEGSRLNANETRLLLASAKGKFTLTALALGVTITCNALSLPEESQMQIQGSSAGNPGKSKEVIHYTGCTVTGNGAGCEVTNGLVITAPVLNLLGYTRSNRTGPIRVLFEPETGNQFTVVQFTGAECIAKQQSVTGNVIGTAQADGLPLEVGKEHAEGVYGEVEFSKTLKSILIESGGVILPEIKGKLALQGNSATLAGIALLGVDLVLAGNIFEPIKWGVFTA